MPFGGFRSTGKLATNFEYNYHIFSPAKVLLVAPWVGTCTYLVDVRGRDPETGGVVLAFSRPPFLFRTSCIPYFFDSYPIYFILIFKLEVARPLFCPFDHLRPNARTLAALRFPSPLFSPILHISPPLFSPPSYLGGLFKQLQSTRDTAS